jgi:hypothetical protein
MPRKKLIHGAYYWVRRKPYNNVYPHWEPMLFDSDGKFHTRGAGWLDPADLRDIGDRIPPQGKKQKTKKAWMPLDFDDRKGRLKPDVNNISSERSHAALDCATLIETPIRVTVSWDKATYDKLNQRERKLRR